MSRRRASTWRPPPPSVESTASAATNPDGAIRKKSFLARAVLWIMGGGIVAIALVAGVWIAWWIYFHIAIDIAIRDQKMGVTLPPEILAIAEITNVLEVAMRGEINAKVPFNQQLTVPLKGRYDLDVELRAKVPLEFDVAYEGILPIDTEAQVSIRTGINYKNLKALRNLDIQTKIPLKFPLPVNLNVPVNQVIDLEYVGPLTADINDELRTVVNTTLLAKLPINQTIRTPVTAALPLTLFPLQEQVRAVLTSLDVELQPSAMLEFGLASNEERDQGPERSASPWGPNDPASAKLAER